MSDDKKAQKEEIDSHIESISAVTDQLSEYSRLMAMDLIAASTLLGVAWFNFSTFEANILLGCAVYLVFNANKRLAYRRIVQAMRIQLLNELATLLVAWKKNHVNK